jgi:hypothetical protein
MSPGECSRLEEHKVDDRERDNDEPKAPDQHVPDRGTALGASGFDSRFNFDAVFIFGHLMWSGAVCSVGGTAKRSFISGFAARSAHVDLLALSDC